MTRVQFQDGGRSGSMLFLVSNLMISLIRKSKCVRKSNFVNVFQFTDEI